MRALVSCPNRSRRRGVGSIRRHSNTRPAAPELASRRVQPEPWALRVARREQGDVEGAVHMPLDRPAGSDGALTLTAQGIESQLGINHPKEITKDYLMPMTGADFIK